MELREKIAEIIRGERLKDNFHSRYVTDQDRVWLLRLADQILTLIQGEWLDKPDSEGWWWFKDDTNNPTAVFYYEKTNDVEVRSMFIPLDKFFKGQWCKAIVPEIGE